MLADGLAALTFGRSSWANKKKADIARFGASLSFFCPFFLLGFFTFFGAGFFAFLGFLAFFATGFLAFFAAGFFAFFAAGFLAASLLESSLLPSLLLPFWVLLSWLPFWLPSLLVFSLPLPLAFWQQFSLLPF